MGIVWCDGSFIGERDFRISPQDRGLCHGLSLFETILAVNGVPCLLKEHLQRLRLGLERLGVTSVELSDTGLHSVIMALLKKNALEQGLARIRLTISMGRGPLNRTDSGDAWAWMTAASVTEPNAPVKMTAAPWKKDTQSVLRGLKVGNYAEHVMALDLARREGFDELLFYNTSNELCEAAMANVFLIRGGVLFTPGLDSGCLAGITRQLIISLAAAHHIKCREKPLSRSDVDKAEGIFLTSSIKGPVWVSSFQSKSYEIHPLFDVIRTMWCEQMFSANP
ncbi:aminotransferase class IV [Luteolibacter algae]|uniref:branched-chain-amino-acid transaminase n=1 Tax=Luteolibacter algae TaxID=454151 RepID=A0ABW5D870_9BACT